MEIAKRKNKWLSVFLIVIFISCFSVCFVKAARELEIVYPFIPGLTDPPKTIKTTLPDYIHYLFNIVIAFSGIMIFFALFKQGIQIVMSAGNPKARRDAIVNIEHIFLGLGLVFSSYLVSKTINPQLVEPQVGIISLSGATFFENSDCSGRRESLTISTPDLNAELGFEPKCLEFNEQTWDLEVFLYDQTDFKGEPERISSTYVQKAGFSGAKKSARLLWRVGGVYLCSEEYEEEGGEWFCNGIEKHLPLSTHILGQDLKNNLGGLKTEVVLKSGMEGENAANDCKSMGGELQGSNCIRPFGAVLHHEADKGGECEIINPLDFDEPTFMDFAQNLTGINPFTGKAPAFNLKETSSVTVFSPKNSSEEDGVYFCREPDPELAKKPGCFGPFKKIMGTFGQDIADELTGKSLQNVPNAEACLSEWFGGGDAISSIIINGNFLVALFANDDLNGLCEVFTEGDSNLIDNPISTCCSPVGNLGRTDCVSSVVVIPIQGPIRKNIYIPPLEASCIDECSADEYECILNDDGTHSAQYKKCKNLDEDECLEWPNDPSEYDTCETGICVYGDPLNICQEF